ncbi:hypothetical protein [Citrobacter phage CVT22]|uniref:Uncharacterized protein n=1 Tax=Citrobacter phage CVT22 TaxID=1622234 RepID=A0A0R6CHP1_9CAUD|nr:hypothetical protein APL39_gp26 [Citrobacter phage CVT22]AJT60785.2 hypothetical protein [Citrobacter phage CVT22]
MKGISNEGLIVPYVKIETGKDKGKYRVKAGKMKGKVISDAQRKAIEANKHKKGKK